MQYTATALPTLSVVLHDTNSVVAISFRSALTAAGCIMFGWQEWIGEQLVRRLSSARTECERLQNRRKRDVSLHWCDCCVVTVWRCHSLAGLRLCVCIGSRGHVCACASVCQYMLCYVINVVSCLMCLYCTQVVNAQHVPHCLTGVPVGCLHQLLSCCLHLVLQVSDQRCSM